MATKAAAVWLAATKLIAPARRPDALLRPRLIHSLSKSLEHGRLTLISAPAGAGKTTLLAELPHAFPETTWAWLLLDGEDNDPSRFAAALLSSLSAAGVNVDEDAPPPTDPRGVITAIINRIGQPGVPAVAMVLEDLHVITEPAVYRLLDYLADHLPPNLQIVLASRHDPPMALGRRRARGELGEIRLPDLSFTEDETAALVNQCLGLNLDSHEVALLHARTEGWAAGLRLLATSISQLPANRATLLGSSMQGSRRIFDFLAEEVLDRQEPDLRNFLLETSILASLRPEVCDRLTGRQDSFRVLDDLYRRNLYVVAADEAETSFRYHDLFADFLRERLRRERPADLSELHRRAALAETSPHNRLRHLLAAQCWDEAAAEIEAIGIEYVRRGFVVTLQRWISEFPHDVRLRFPRLLYLLGHAIWTQSEFAQAQPYLEQALEGFRRNNDYEGQGETLAALANSALMNSRFDESHELIREALSFDIPPDSRVQLHSAGTWNAIYRQNWVEAEQHLDRVFQLVESGTGVANPLAIQLVLFSEGLPGYVDRIEKLCTSMRRRLTGPPDLAHGAYHLLNGAVLLHRGDMDEAEREAKLSHAIASEHGQIVLLIAALCTSRAVTAAAQNRWDDMDAWSSDGLDETKYGQITRNWRLHFLFLQARARWHSGDTEGLRRTFDDAMLPNSVEAPAAIPYRHLIRGMLAMAEHAHAQAERAFRDALREEDAFKVSRAISSARAMLAYALLVRGKTGEAMEVFSPYLDESETGNLTGQLTRENPYIIPLLRHARERNIRRDYVERVLEMLGAPLDAVEATGSPALSERELEVLRVMAQGLANRAIAEQLFVSEATVKTHVQRILRKLESASRTQAVARARDLMLL